jgi:hypothetical protein
MQRLGVICGVLYVCSLVAPSGAAACTEPRLRVSIAPGAQFSDAVIRFKIVEVSAPGMAEAIEGQVDLLVGSRWLPLRNGNRLGNGARLWIAPCAKLVVRFSQSDRLEFQQQEAGRWVLLQITKP